VFTNAISKYICQYGGVFHWLVMVEQTTFGG
jgi:hypothetical protein